MKDMEHEQMDKGVARKAALIYLPISVGAALLFLIAASMLGDYPTVARAGGMIWVGLLSLIVSMPIVISRAKKRWRGKAIFSRKGSAS